jgi:hypothetical protein
VAPASAAADTGDPLAYYGGPVAHAMTGVIVDWGHHVNPIFTNPVTGDPGLLSYLAEQSGSPDGIGGVLAQYLDTSGMNSANAVTFGGQFTITPSTSATTVQDSQVASELTTQIAEGVLPAPSGDGMSTDYLVLLPAGVTVCDSDGCSGQAFCSYHGSTQMAGGVALLYEVLPDDTTGPMTQGCGSGSPLRNQTMYLSHEWEETIDDPLVDDASSFGPPLSWYDARCPTDSSLCGEVADKCNQQPTVEGGWTVQLLWSNLDDACVGGEEAYGTPTVSLALQGTATPGAPATFVASTADPPGNTASATWQGQQFRIAAGVASLTWNWGDGSPPVTLAAAGGSPATHTYAAPGVYDVTVTVTDNLGFTGRATLTIGVWGAQGAPVPQTGAAANVTPTTATLAGTLNPAGVAVSYRFEYGTSATALAQRTAVLGGLAGITPVPVTAGLTGLEPHTTYYYRLDAIVGGHALPGGVASFRTLRATRGSATIARLASAGTRGRRRRSRRRERSAILIRSGSDAVVPVPVAILPGQTLASSLRHGLAVAFRCPNACRVTLAATLRLHGALAAVAVPRVLASGHGRLRRHGGGGTARLRFSTSARAWLSHLPDATFAATGFAEPAG